MRRSTELTGETKTCLPHAGEARDQPNADFFSLLLLRRREVPRPFAVLANGTSLGFFPPLSPAAYAPRRFPSIASRKSLLILV